MTYETNNIKFHVIHIKGERFYYRLRRSNMIYETKNIIFHVIHVKVNSYSQCSRTLTMCVAIQSAHCGYDCERKHGGV